MSDVSVTCTCGAPMVERTNGQNGSTFIGCTKFPECRETQKVPAYLEVVRAGGTPLPGFEEG